MNIELNFPPKLRGARSRLYRRRFLEVNTRWKALAEIYTMHSFALFLNLKISAKNRQHFSRMTNEFPIFFTFCVEFCIFPYANL